jgi:hypothetical protein
MTGRVVETTTYLHIGKDRRTWSLRGIVRKHSNSRPDEPAAGCVVVKLRLRIPAEAFEPLAPEAVIDVPADLIQRPIEVEAGDLS